MQEVDVNYESDNSTGEYSLGEGDKKKRKYCDEERLQRCRERNRVHARNTRERKRVQMEGLQQKIQDLMDEKIRLTNLVPDTSIASILMSLSSNDKDPSSLDTDIIEQLIQSSSSDNLKDAKKSATITMDNLRAQVTALLNEDGDLELDQTMLSQFKDKSNCTSMELDKIRRERNRMHAKKTRLRKKKMLNEMETIISNLEEDIYKLRMDLINQGVEIESLETKKDCSSSSSIDIKLEKKTSRNGPPTGFRHSKYRIHDNSASIHHSSSSSATSTVSKKTTSQMNVENNNNNNELTMSSSHLPKEIKFHDEQFMYMNNVETSSTVSSNEGSSLNGSGSTSRDGNNSSNVDITISSEDKTNNEYIQMNNNDDNNNYNDENSHSLSSLEYKMDIIPLRKISSKLSIPTNCAENIYLY